MGNPPTGDLRTAGAPVGEEASLADELIARAAALVTGKRRPSGADDGPFPRLDRCEQRARAMAATAPGAPAARHAARHAAAVHFVGDAVAGLSLDGALGREAVSAAVGESAAILGLPASTLRLLVFRRALANREALQFSPRLTIEYFLQLLVDLDVVEASSLWVEGPAGRLRCLAAAGDAPRSRRLAGAARAALEGAECPVGYAVAAPIERWDRRYAALAVRRSARQAHHLKVFLDEAAEAISPLLERETLFERGSERERDLVAAAERRSVRLAFDLHDGPLQELVALAADLRLARAQVGGLLAGREQALVDGRFDDLEARLVELDRALRDIVHSARLTGVLERPLEDSLRHELGLVERAGVAVMLRVDGDLGELTDSQKIVLYRVVQEALANIRKHSCARSVAVHLVGAPTYVSASVSDDGCGFDPADAVDCARRRDRFGLSGIVERVRLLGGDVEITSSPGAGATVRATLPRWKPLTTIERPALAVPA